MSRKKIKALFFVDYLINIFLSVIGIVIFAFLFKFQIGYFIYSVVFCLSLLGFMYSRAYTAAKIDRRNGDSRLSSVIKLIAPLIFAGLLIIILYSLILYKVIPIGDIVLITKVNPETNISESLLLIDVIALVIRGIFINLAGFMPGGRTNPLILLINEGVIVLGALLGYYCGTRKIYISEYIEKFKEFVKKKFYE